MAKMLTLRRHHSETVMPNIHPADNGDVYVSGAATLREIAGDPAIQSSYPLLADACSSPDAHDRDESLSENIATPSACVRTADGVACALNGGAACAAADPSSDLHAIIDGGPCWRAYTSLPGVALHALDAVVEYGNDDRAGAMQRVRLPADAARGFQRLFRPAAGHAPDAAHITLAAVRRADGDVRLVLGGVAPRPYRIYTSVEEEAMAGGLDEDTIAGLAERALLDAESHAASANRVDVATALLRGAIAEIDASSR